MYFKNKFFLISFFSCIILGIIIFQHKVYAQWLTDVRLTNISGNSFTGGIASNGNYIHVIWCDWRDGNEEIYFKRSTNNGGNWGADIRLTNNSSSSQAPSITVSNANISVTWMDFRSGNWEIYYKRSTNNGTNWISDAQLTIDPAISFYPSISASGSNIHVVWYDSRNGNEEIYYKRSTDDGISWGVDIRLTNNSANSNSPSVASSGAIVTVVWRDLRDGNEEIYFKRSINNGFSWESDIRLTNDTFISYTPSVALSGSVIHVVWTDARDGNQEIYNKRSTNVGLTWGSDTRLTNHTLISVAPMITLSGTAVHVVWTDYRDGNNEIYYKRSTNGGLAWGTDIRLTNNSESSSGPSLTVSGATVHVLWYDHRDGNYEIYYKRDTTGNPIGIKNINSEVPKEFKLEQNYPNPFNPVTKIRFELPKSSIVKLVVNDINGRVLETIVNAQLNAGIYEADWNAAKYSSGIYYYNLKAEYSPSIFGHGYNETRKMVLIK